MEKSNCMCATVPYGIQRIDYVVKSWLPDLTFDKTRYLFYPDGCVVIETYERNSRKRESKNEYMLSQDEVLTFYRQVAECAKNADGFGEQIDDQSGTITIHYHYLHTEVLDRGICGNGTSIDEIISRLLDSIMN